MLMSAAYDSFLDELKAKSEKETTGNITGDISSYQKTKLSRTFTSLPIGFFHKKDCYETIQSVRNSLACLF